MHVKQGSWPCVRLLGYSVESQLWDPCDISAEFIWAVVAARKVANTYEQYDKGIKPTGHNIKTKGLTMITFFVVEIIGCIMQPVTPKIAWTKG